MDSIHFYVIMANPLNQIIVNTVSEGAGRLLLFMILCTCVIYGVMKVVYEYIYIYIYICVILWVSLNFGSGFTALSQRLTLIHKLN